MIENLARHILSVATEKQGRVTMSTSASVEQAGQRGNILSSNFEGVGREKQDPSSFFT